MLKQVKLMILANAAFAFLFIFFNWAGYEMLNASRTWNIQTYFPFYIYGQSVSFPMVTGFTAFILPNYLLAIFLLSTTVNLYFIFKLAKNQEPLQSN